MNDRKRTNRVIIGIIAVLAVILVALISVVVISNLPSRNTGFGGSGFGGGGGGGGVSIPVAKNPYTMDLYSNKSSVLIGEEENPYIYLETDIEEETIELYNVENESEAVVTLYDDGDFDGHGDDMAGDGIYSAQLQDMASEDFQIVLVAIYDGYKSNELQIRYYTLISDEENEMMGTVDVKIDEILTSDGFEEKTLEEKEEIVEVALNAFVESGEISDGSVLYSEDAELFSFQYSNGVLGGVMIGEFDQLQSPYIDDETFDSNNVNKYANNLEMPTNGIEEEKYPLGNALILNSFPSFETDKKLIAYRTGFYNTVKSDWDAKGLNTTIDTDVVVSDYLYLDDYEVVCISTHGNVYTWYDGFLWSQKHTVPAICLSEASSDEKNKQYSSYLKNKEIAKVNGEYWILPAFFENEYGSGTLENTFVFSECCMALGTGQGSSKNNYDYTMANAFVNSSVKAYIGFHNSVFADYSREFMKNYVDKLIEGEKSIDAYNDSVSVYGSNHEIWYNNNSSYSLKDYYEIHKKNPKTGKPATEKYKPKVHIAYPVHNGDKDARLVEVGIKNGDFEKYNVFTTSPRFWNAIGDVRSLTQLGDVKPSSGDGRMAVISTGIGANSTNMIENGTEGSIVSQTFVVPNNANKLVFDYNLISEEPMEYVGTKYNDAFAVKIICGKDTVFDNTYESINSSTWTEIGGIDFSGGDSTVYHTDWKSAEIDVTAYKGKVITLRFVIYDVGDSIYDSACVIDNVMIK